MNFKKYRVSEFKGNIDKAISVLSSNGSYGKILSRGSINEHYKEVKYKGKVSRILLADNNNSNSEEKIGKAICKIIESELNEDTFPHTINSMNLNQCKDFYEIRSKLHDNGFVPFSFLVVIDYNNKKKYLVGLGKSKRDIGPCVIVDDKKFGFSVLDMKAFYWSELEWENCQTKTMTTLENVVPLTYAVHTTHTYKTSTGRSG